MKCIVCGKELKAGDLIVRYECLEMESSVSVTSKSYGSGVVHVGCLDGLKEQVMQDLGTVIAVTGA